MAETFHDFERAGWTDVGVCASYDEHFARITTQSVGALLDAAGVGPGHRVLDVATGAGYVAGEALARGALVTGGDFSPVQVGMAAQRYPGARFREFDAASLPFEDRSFDAVVSNFGVLHFPEPDAFFREAFRVLAPGGRVAFTVWDVPQEAKLFAAVSAAIQAHGSPDIVLPPGPNMFMFSDPAVCREALAQAGFRDCVVRKVPQIWRATSSEEILEAVAKGTVRARGSMVRQPREALPAIEQAILAALAAFKVARGYEVPMPAILAGAIK